MGHEDTVTEVAANGTSSPKKIGKVLSKKKAKEKDEVKEKEEDGRDGEKVETHKMDVDQDAKETKEEGDSKEEEEEEKEETSSEAMKEDIVMKGDGESKEAADGEEEKAEESIQEKGSKKHGKRKSSWQKVNNKKKEKKEEPKTPVVSAIERPVRERKSVERLVESTEKEAVKEFNIEKGRGTALKDIPNVAYKLSRKKTDDTFKLLHTILFGRRGKAFQVKNNISQFSGFVWNQNEAKQKIKVKEKLDKCVKEKLLEFCDVFDIPIAKATIKKEDIVIKLIDFLVAPHATTNELLADKEQSSKGKKRRRVVKGSASLSGNTPSESSAKRRRKIESTSTREVKKSTSETAGESEEDDDEEDNVNIVPEKKMHEHSDSEAKENESEDESQEGSRKHKRGSKKSSANKKSAGKAKNEKITTTKKAIPLLKRTPTNSSSSRSKADHSTDTSPKKFSRKKKNEEVVKEKSLTPKRSAAKDKNGKKIVKGKDKPKEDKLRPNDDELKNAVCQILKEVDFNMATFTDILKQLAGRFNTDLTPRKSSIKLMIQDELTKLAEAADDEEE